MWSAFRLHCRTCYTKKEPPRRISKVLKVPSPCLSHARCRRAHRRPPRATPMRFIFHTLNPIQPSPTNHLHTPANPTKIYGLSLNKEFPPVTAVYILLSPFLLNLYPTCIVLVSFFSLFLFCLIIHPKGTTLHIII